MLSEGLARVSAIGAIGAMLVRSRGRSNSPLPELLRFGTGKLESDVSAVGLALKREGDDIHIVRCELVAMGAIPSIYPFAPRRSGCLRCHSSILSFINLPGMSRDTKDPVGSVIFPSAVLLHFPS